MTKRYQERSLEIAKIQLDEQNPRFTPANNQKEAIRKMLIDQGLKVCNLAEDIFLYGLNPSSKLIVIKEKGRFIDGDGNRRLTALKLLETPALAKDFPSIVKKINNILRNNGNVPTAVDCVIFNNREEAKRWISINHSGEQAGKGQIHWDAEQKDRFDGRRSIGLQALDMLLEASHISEADKNRIKKSTLDRLLSFKCAKERLSIEKTGALFKFNSLDELRRVVLNLRDLTVDEVYTSAKGQAFINETLTRDEPNKSDGGNSSEGIHNSSDTDPKGEAGRRTRATKGKSLPIFGSALSLRPGPVNNLYRDIEAIHLASERGSIEVTEEYVNILRMALRLLTETASEEDGLGLADYISKYFSSAKKRLDKDYKNTLSQQNVQENTLIRQLQSGAHPNTNAKNREQALAISIIVGAMLSISHCKK